MRQAITCSGLFPVDRLEWQSMSSVSVLTEAASRFKSHIVVQCGDLSVNAKSLMSLMLIDAARQTAMTVVAHGHDAPAAMETITQVLSV